MADGAASTITRAPCWRRGGARLVMAAALAFVATATSSCILADNPRYCDANTPCTDPSRTFCDQTGEYRASDGVRNQCIPEPGCRLDGCGVEAPVCDLDSETCASCQEDADCARFDDASVCDADGTCIGCRQHSDCESDACHPLTHQCAEAAEVLYVVEGAPDAGDCSRASPCGGLDHALALTTPSRWIIRLASGSYDGSVTIPPRRIAIIADPGTVVSASVGTPQETLIVGPGADLLLHGLIVLGVDLGSEADEPAILCQDYSPAEAARLHLDLVRVSGATAAAVEARNCEVALTRSALTKNGLGLNVAGGRLDVRRSVISENAGGGAIVSIATLGFRNNFVWGNGSMAGESAGGAFLTDIPDGSHFDHNTVVGNVAQSGAPGVVCNGELTLANNILYDNIDGQDGVGCSHRFSIIGPAPVDGPGNLAQAPIFLDPGSGGDPHLDPSSPGVDQAEPSDLLEDIDGEVRPQGAGPDMGADEVTPAR